jgi:hypothetical protein
MDHGASRELVISQYVSDSRLSPYIFLERSRLLDRTENGCTGFR